MLHLHSNMVRLKAIIYTEYFNYNDEFTFQYGKIKSMSVNWLDVLFI